MLRVLCAAALFCATTTFADTRSGQIGDVRYAILDDRTAVFQTSKTEWTVFCQPSTCQAAAGDMVLTLTPEDLTIATPASQPLSWWHNREELDLPVGTPFDPYERSALRQGGSLVLIDPDQPSVEVTNGVSLDGFAIVMTFMERLVGETPETPNSYLALVDGLEQSDKPHLVPFTKPQIEFAIRSQTDID